MDYEYTYEYTFKVMGRVEKEFKYITNFITRLPKNKVAILEDGCLNYAIREVKIADDKMGIEVYLDGMRPRYIEGAQLVDGNIRIGKDRKYGIISYIRMR